MFLKNISRLSLTATLLVAGVTVAWSASTVLGPDRHSNLKLLETAPLLFEYHRLTTGDMLQSFAYPRRDTTFQKNFVRTEQNALLYYDNACGAMISGHFGSDSSAYLDSCRAQSPRIALATSLVGGIDYRGGETLGDTIWPGLDGGIYMRGYADSVDFVLDARIYDESHTAKNPKSFDREFVEVQKEENNSGVEYTSYARYRTHFGFNHDWLRVDLGRDVMHWGPGYYNNLTLNQFALPYNMLSMDMRFGPLRVISFYADLRVYNNSMSMKNKDDTRNLFGHRYELAGQHEALALCADGAPVHGKGKLFGKQQQWGPGI